MRDTPTDPMALYAVALLFGTRVAETILASVHVRAHPQAGHMDASNLIKALQNTLRGGGRPHMGLGQEWWLGKFGQTDKWKICLRAARMPHIRSDKGEKSTHAAKNGLSSVGGAGGRPAG